jgi:REP element-mobilizing transposase RayT
MPMAAYHLTICTSGRHPLFRDPAAVMIAMTALHRCASLGHCTNHAWVLMPDHLHWLLSMSGTRSLASVVSGFKANTSRALARAGIVSSSPWQTGYYEHRLRDDQDLRQQARYLDRQPRARRSGQASGRLSMVVRTMGRTTAWASRAASIR